MDDGELLKRYVAAGSEEAFRSLVERNLPLVYSAALRKTNNRSMAEDVTQVVFIILAKKAHELSKGTILAGWLHRTAWHVSMKALVTECRRRQREEKAVQMQTAEQDADWESLAPLLDDALAQLGDAERSAVVLRYFQNRSFIEVGKALGISDDTAQKKVTRSVDKLRKFLFKRGIAISVVGFVGLMATRAAQFAPETLAERVIPAALKDAGVSSTVYALLQEAIKPALTLKVAGAWAAAAAVAIALTAWAAKSSAPPEVPSSRRVVQESAPQQPTQQPTAAVSAALEEEPKPTTVVVQNPAPVPLKPVVNMPAPVTKTATSQPPVTQAVVRATPIPQAPTPVLNPPVAQNPSALSQEPLSFDVNSLNVGDGSYPASASDIVPLQNRMYPITFSNRGTAAPPPRIIPSQRISPQPSAPPKSSGTIRRRPNP
jgi:RNA polymerase sigma factor (sigma-70 family)